MSSSNLFKFFLASAFLLSVAWKIAIPSINSNDLKDDLVDFLERNYFDIVVTEKRVNFVSMIEAKTASCRLRIIRLAVDGSDWDMVQHLGAGADRCHRCCRGLILRRRTTSMG